MWKNIRNLWASKPKRCGASWKLWLIRRNVLGFSWLPNNKLQNHLNITTKILRKQWVPIMKKLWNYKLSFSRTLSSQTIVILINDIINSQIFSHWDINFENFLRNIVALNLPHHLLSLALVDVPENVNFCFCSIQILPNCFTSCVVLLHCTIQNPQRRTMGYEKINVFGDSLPDFCHFLLSDLIGSPIIDWDQSIGTCKYFNPFKLKGVMVDKATACFFQLIIDLLSCHIRMNITVP